MTVRELTEGCVELVRKAEMSYQESVNFFSCQLINSALKESKGRRGKAAKLLQIHRNTLTRHLQQLEAQGFPIIVEVRRRRLPESYRTHRVDAMENRRQFWEGI